MVSGISMAHPMHICIVLLLQAAVLLNCNEFSPSDTRDLNNRKKASRFKSHQESEAYQEGNKKGTIPGIDVALNEAKDKEQAVRRQMFLK